jgi:hypothetical protein
MDSKDFKSKTLDHVEDTNSSKADSRYKNLTVQIVRFIEDLKADDIYNAMKDSEYSKQYAVQRVKEMFEESMNTEKEVYIDRLENQIAENNDLIAYLKAQNLEYQNEYSLVYQKLESTLLEKEKLLKELDTLRDDIRKSADIIDNFKAKNDYDKNSEFYAKSMRKYEEEIEFARSQTLKYKSEVENLKKSKEITDSKQIEYEKDHYDLVNHIKSIQFDKECLENEIDRVSNINFELKESKNYLSIENEALHNKIKHLESALNTESQTNQQEIQKILEKFREKSKKFKSKILEQRTKIEELTQESTKTLNTKLPELEKLLSEEKLHNKELEISISKQKIDFNQHLESVKKHYESLMNAKISEMQKDVDLQVSKCQGYEKDLKVVMDNNINALEHKNKELDLSNKELMSQLASALEGLEKLRSGYSEQISNANMHESEATRLRNLIQETQYQCKIKDSKANELEKRLEDEQDRVLQEHRLRIKSEAEANEYEQTLWKLKEELEITKNQHQTMTLNYESALAEYRCSLKSENLKFSEALEKVRSLENYSKSLEIQIQNIQTESLKKSMRIPPRYNKCLKIANLNSKNKQKLKEIKNFAIQSFSSLEDAVKDIIQTFSYKMIEKVSENRKLKSNLSTIKKENYNLNNSVTICSKEFDELSKELLEKQRSIKETSKSLQQQIKEKFKEKYLKLETKLQQAEKEKIMIEIESHKQINLLKDEVKALGSHISSNLRMRDNADHKKCNQEIFGLEKRITELESFLDAERFQKAQISDLKNKEIEDLKGKLFSLKSQTSHQYYNNGKY